MLPSLFLCFSSKVFGCLNVRFNIIRMDYFIISLAFDC
ncbi:hypothetical protein RUE5091_04307 [Ruegeria denitrificans]|uniref:Uncharacterized protein n=1 Tax=Ruegeria denitrificans TaxID=1715692 RepID=A0A0P1ISC2_9RHOB|nr:hypothetical protein RUE5091_04307 [Ruegeria denitrificans]